jgi:AraC-like DNA-binding protein
MNDIAIYAIISQSACVSQNIATHLYLPSKDRSFWNGIGSRMPLLYLAWGRRNFKNDQIPISRHQGWIVCLIMEGNATLTLEKENIPVSKGNLILIGPDCASGWSSTKKGDCRIILWMWDELQDLNLKLLKDSYWLTSIPTKQREPYTQLHDTCRREVVAIDEHSKVFLTGCRMQIQSLIERSKKQPDNKELDSVRYKIALQWFTEHLDSKQPIARICDYLNISQPSLYRLFHSQTKQSPQAYFKSLKMEHAKKLITTTDMSVKEIAFALGYDHFNDFSRAIKDHFKVSPRALKVKNKNPKTNTRVSSRKT